MSISLRGDSWVEIDESALRHNANVIRACAPNSILCFCVKANAYGHGAIQVAGLLEKYAPQSWLGVHSADEARKLREARIKLAIYIMGPLFIEDIPDVLRLGARFVVYDEAHLRSANQAAQALGVTARVHLKIETGNNRQGVNIEEALRLCTLTKTLAHVEIEGIATHFANIEDDGGDTLPPYAQCQLEKFTDTLHTLERAGFSFKKIHCANSAATLLFPKTHFSMVRPGIALYGLWPSESVARAFQKKYPQKTLRPVLSWKTKVGQVKSVRAGSAIGYGCTYVTERDSRIAILPIGYFDGYDRGLSNTSEVVVRGKRAPIRGRICMNMCMVDCTDIPNVCVGDEVILIGKSTDSENTAQITADDLATYAGTITYEITTRIREGIPRLIV